MSGPLAYLILPHDVCRGLEDGTLAACWALQASHVLDVAGSLPDALRAAEACSWRTGAAVSLLAVTVAGQLDATAPYDDDARCRCGHASYLHDDAYGACCRCESCAMLDVGSPAPAGREVL